jgi:small redox-active disulfide protein 2
MKVEVLGPGCKRCGVLYEAVVAAVAEAGVDAEVVKVQALDEIMNRGVLLTPALVIDGTVVSSGREPSAAQIVEMLRTAGA